ncbi:unnamed protein product [Ectocarpus sp. 8 AP-2014]
MGLFQVLCVMAVVARSQELQNFSVGTSPFTVGSTEDAATLAMSIQCSNGDFSVQWVEEVFVVETIYVTDGTSLIITGVGPEAIADGGDSTQLFVADRGSNLHLSDVILTNGNAFDGGAIHANQSSVSFGGNTIFSSNSATEGGGAIYAYDSRVSWDGDGIQFNSNHAGEDGGAIYAVESTVSWDGDDTYFYSNFADNTGGAIYAYESTASWDGDYCTPTSSAISLTTLEVQSTPMNRRCPGMATTPPSTSTSLTILEVQSTRMDR